MLFLAAGIGSITLLPPVGSLLAGDLASIRAVPLADSDSTVVGLLLVLYSIVVARAE